MLNISSFLPTLNVIGSGVAVGEGEGLGLAVWLGLGRKVGVALGTGVSVWLGSGGRIAGMSGLAPQELKRSIKIRKKVFK